MSEVTPATIEAPTETPPSDATVPSSAPVAPEMPPTPSIPVEPEEPVGTEAQPAEAVPDLQQQIAASRDAYTSLQASHEHMLARLTAANTRLAVLGEVQF